MKKIRYILFSLILFAGLESPVVYATNNVGESTSIGIDVRIGFDAEEVGGDEPESDSTYPDNDATVLPPKSEGLGSDGTAMGNLPETGAIRLQLFVFGLLAVAIGWLLALLVKLEKERSVKVD